MKITKYEHACVVIEEQGKKLVIDPGAFAKSLPANLDGVAAVVITHIHGDHFDEGKVKNISNQNPDAQIFSTQEVANQLKDLKVNPVTSGSQATAGPFKLEFFGGQHAHVHDTQPVAQNVGVFVNQSLYYPGDSFDSPSGLVKVLAIPTSGPWLKTGDSMDFWEKIKPQTGFPTHDAFLSEIGENYVNNWLDQAAKESGDEYKALRVGESFDV
jgi:L-ascorbate metabolism protein UlaG (beta-lactamase superfamily)